MKKGAVAAASLPIARTDGSENHNEPQLRLPADQVLCVQVLA
jgi:hypothetical protein